MMRKAIMSVRGFFIAVCFSLVSSGAFSQAYVVTYEERNVFVDDCFDGIDDPAMVAAAKLLVGEQYNLNYLYFDGRTFVYSKTVAPKGGTHFVAKNDGDQVFLLGDKVARRAGVLYDRNYVVEDSIFVQGWRFDFKASRVVLGFRCVKAVKDIDGLETTAWFTDQLPLPVGPSNVFGLPGLALRVETEFMTWEAKQVEACERLADVVAPEGERIGAAAYLELFRKERLAHGDDPDEDGRHYVKVEVRYEEGL